MVKFEYYDSWEEAKELKATKVIAKEIKNRKGEVTGYQLSYNGTVLRKKVSKLYAKAFRHAAHTHGLNMQGEEFDKYSVYWNFGKTPNYFGYPKEKAKYEVIGLQIVLED